MRRINGLDYVALILLIVGGLNWGLVGLLGVDLVATLFGAQSTLSSIVYIIVGIAAIYAIFTSLKLSSRAEYRTT